MLTVSLAQPDDATEIQQIYLALGRPARAELLSEHYLVVREPTCLAGCAAVRLIATRERTQGYLYGLAVRNEFQRRGIGRALTEARLERIRCCGGTDAIALAMFWNVGFFRRLGFVTVRREELSLEVRELPDFRDTRYRRSAVVYKRVTG